jgi:hypothetical protein
MSGINDRVTPDPAGIPEIKPYVRAALADLAAGRPVAEAVSYGCGEAFKRVV